MALREPPVSVTIARVTPGMRFGRSLVTPSPLLSDPVVMLNGLPLCNLTIDVIVHPFARKRAARFWKLAFGFHTTENATTCLWSKSERCRSSQRLFGSWGLVLALLPVLPLVSRFSLCSDFDHTQNPWALKPCAIRFCTVTCRPW